MKLISLYRPSLHILLPNGLLLIGSAIAGSLAFQLDDPIWLLIGIALTSSAIIAGLHQSKPRYDIYAAALHNDLLYPPVLVTHRGFLGRRIDYISLMSVARISIDQPIWHGWCDQARVTIHLIDGSSIPLGLIGNASIGATLLYTLLPAAPRAYR